MRASPRRCQYGEFISYLIKHLQSLLFFFPSLCCCLRFRFSASRILMVRFYFTAPNSYLQKAALLELFQIHHLFHSSLLLILRSSVSTLWVAAKTITLSAKEGGRTQLICNITVRSRVGWPRIRRLLIKVISDSTFTYINGEERLVAVFHRRETFSHALPSSHEAFEY